MTTLAELARIRKVYGLAPVGGILWLGIGMRPPKRNAIEIDPANLPTALECRAVAGLDVVVLFPGTSTKYGTLRTLSDRLYEARPRRLLLADSDHGRTAFLKLAKTDDEREHERTDGRLHAGQRGRCRARGAY